MIYQFSVLRSHILINKGAAQMAPSQWFLKHSEHPYIHFHSVRINGTDTYKGAQYVVGT